MATIGDLLKSMDDALARSRDAQAAAVQAMAESAARIKATGVRVSSETSSKGVRVRFTENPRSRSQVRFSPAEVAAKASDRIAQAGEDAVKGAVSR